MSKFKICKMVDPELSDLIESYDYEYSSRKDIIAYMIGNNMDTATDAFNKYQKEMIEYSVKFNEAKSRLEDEYIYKDLECNLKPLNWILDYRTKTLNIDFEKID